MFLMHRTWKEKYGSCSTYFCHSNLVKRRFLQFSGSLWCLLVLQLLQKIFDCNYYEADLSKKDEEPLIDLLLFNFAIFNTLNTMANQITPLNLPFSRKLCFTTHKYFCPKIKNASGQVFNNQGSFGASPDGGLQNL